MRPRHRRVEFQRLLRRRIRFRYEVIRIAAITVQHAIGIRQSGIGQRITGIFVNGLIEVGNCRLDVGAVRLFQ